MAFNFGGLNTNTKLKSLSGQKIDSHILYDNFKPEEDYYLFLLEGRPMVENDLTTIKNLIDKSGYSSYIIASATTKVYNPEEATQKYEYMKVYASPWKSLINYKGAHVKAIMPFGSALYAINKGTDLMTECFYDSVMNKPYYYIGHGFIGNYDTFIFPVDGVESLYPKEYKKGKAFKPNDSNVNWKTRFFYEQLKNMLGKKELPEDMSEYKIICANDTEVPAAGTRLVKHYAKDILKSLMNSKILAWDTETSGLKWYREDYRIGCFTFCNDGKNGYYIPADYIFNDEENRKLLCEVMYSCDTMVGANIKFDLHFLMKHIPEFDLKKVKKIDDIGQMSHCINSNRTKGLKPLAFFYTPFGGYDDELDVYKSQTGCENYLKIPQSILSQYATIDAIMTYRIFIALGHHIDWIDENFPNEKPIDWTMRRWYEEIMVPVYRSFIKMEHRGMMMDPSYMEDVRQKLQKAAKNYTEILCKEWNVPADFKFGSTTELGKLFEKMKWPKVEESKAGLYATNDECIAEWRRQKLPGIETFVKLREVNSFLGTFIGYKSEDGNPDNANGWEKFIHYHDEDNSFRIHQSYNVMGTETFRCIGKDPNLQNIPAHSKLAEEVRRCITVPTAIHYSIECDGELYEGGELDTVQVENKGRISLADIEENDTIIKGSFIKYTPPLDSYFASCVDSESFNTDRSKLYGLC